MQIKYKQHHEARETGLTKCQLPLIVRLIGCEDGRSFLDQSHCEVNQKQSNPVIVSLILKLVAS